MYSILSSLSDVQAYEDAAKEQQNVAGQLSLWGEETGDENVSDISDKLGVLLRYFHLPIQWFFHF